MEQLTIVPDQKEQIPDFDHLGFSVIGGFVKGAHIGFIFSVKYEEGERRTTSNLGEAQTKPSVDSPLPKCC